MPPKDDIARFLLQSGNASGRKTELADDAERGQPLDDRPPLPSDMLLLRGGGFECPHTIVRAAAPEEPGRRPQVLTSRLPGMIIRQPNTMIRCYGAATNLARPGIIEHSLP